MLNTCSRRQFGFLAASALIGLAPGTASAIEPFPRLKVPRLRLGLAAYSFRQFFKNAARPERNLVAPERQIDLFQFIDYCVEHGCDGAELTSYYFPANASNKFLLEIKRHAFLRGIDLCGTAIGNTFTHPAGEKLEAEIALTKKWIEHAALMGIPHIRVFAGNAENQPLEVAKKNCIAALEECCAYAGKHGVFLGLENHGGIVAEPEVLIDIVKTVQSPWLGINLDSGNFRTDDPYRDFEKCVPYSVNVQLKTEIQVRGRRKESADLKRFVKSLREGNYAGYVTIEYEAAEEPYQAIPKILEELRPLLA